MNRITTLILLILVMALGFFFLFKKENPPALGNPPILQGFDVASVSAVFFENLDRGTRASFRRVPGGWELSQPIVYPAESAVVASILSPFEHNTCSRIADLKVRPDLPLESYGLDKPKAVLRLTQSGRDREVLIGKETLSGDQVFVLADGQLLQTSRNLYNATQRNLDEMRAKEIFRIAYDAVVDFEIWRGQENMRFVARQGLWDMELPWKEPAETTEVAGLLSGLAGIRVEKFYDDHPGPDLAYGLDPPMYRVVLRDGKREDTLAIGRGPEGEYLARRADFPFVWKLRQDVEKFFQQAPGEFRDRIFFRAHREQIEELRLLTDAGETVLRFKDGAWRMVSPREYALEPASVEDFLDHLQRLQVAEFPPAESISFAQAGLDAPAYSVQMKSRGAAPVRVLFGKRDDKGRRYAQRDGAQTLLLIEEAKIPFLTLGPLDFVEKTLFSFDEKNLKRIEILRREESGESKKAWIRDELGRWRALGADEKPTSEGEDLRFAALLDSFLFWKGGKALFDSPEPSLFAKPWIEIRYFLGSAQAGSVPEFIAPIVKSQTGTAWTRGRNPIVFEVDPKRLETVLSLF